MTCAEMRRRSLAGKSTRELAEAAGTSQSTILRQLRELDVRVRPQGGHWLPAELHGATFRLYFDEGPTAAETGNALGVSR